MDRFSQDKLSWNCSKKILGPKCFWTQLSFGPKKYLRKKICDPNIFELNLVLDPKSFWTHKVLENGVWLLRWPNLFVMFSQMKLPIVNNILVPRSPIIKFILATSPICNFGNIYFIVNFVLQDKTKVKLCAL